MKKAIAGLSLAILALGAVDVALASSGQEKSGGCKNGDDCITAPKQEVPTKGCDQQPC